MRNLIPFQFESSEVRAVVVDGSPLFGSRDVALALGYANPAEAYQTHCKSLKLLSYSELLELKWVNPNPRGEYVMPESDVYRLIVKSEKPEAERFEKWLFEEVLPSIRQTGSYSIPTTKPQTVKLTGEERGRLMLAREAYKTAKLFGFAENMAVLSAENFVRNTTGVGVLVSMGATHLLADPKGMTYTVTEIGKRLSPPKSAIATNLLFECAGLQTKEFGQWLPTDKADGLFEWLDTGKRHSNGTPVKQIKWFATVLTALDHFPARPQLKEAA